MKKFLSLTLIFVLCLALAACTQDDTPQTGLSDETTANLIDVSISIANKAGDVAAAEDFAAVEDAEFSVEEGTNVLDATQIYCVSNDLSIELGGSGIFRPEVTEPLGIKEPVLAWGLGIDRMALMHLGLNDLRELFTPDIESVRTRRGN